ncbi:MAG: hypothetical protein VX125_15915 [Pseudomonadota bacterium]|nr:hypothetical protein [Pseudomonadota bacterium]
MDINKEREDFEKLWTGGNGHLRFFKFDHDACKYLLNGVTDNLPQGDLLSASITLNTAWLFWLGAKKQATPQGFVLVRKELPEEIAESMALERVEKPVTETDPTWIKISEDAYKARIQSKKWELWRDYKAMIEAQEQSHD